METHTDTPVVRVDNAGRHFKSGEQTVRAIDGVSLELHKGEFAALAGPSGSGKTTLLNLIGGLDRPAPGEIAIDGRPTAALSDNELTRLRLHKIGFVFQSYNLIPVLTAYENIAFILQIQGVPEERFAARINPVLEELGLKDLAQRRPTQLSGGQQQRVAVARAVVGNPALVLADEPTANLDSENAEALMALMKRLNEKQGVTFLFSSHDPLVLKSARRVIGMRDGKIVNDETR